MQPLDATLLWLLIPNTYIPFPCGYNPKNSYMGICMVGCHPHGPVSLRSGYGHKEDAHVRSEVLMSIWDLNNVHLWFEDLEST